MTQARSKGALGRGLRDSKKLQVRSELAAAAIALFAKKGFDAVTVDEIVGAVNVSRRSFFRYFPTKDAAFFARRADQTQRLRTLLSVPLEGEAPFDTVRRALLTLADEHLAQKKQILIEHKVLAKAPALLASDLEHDRVVGQAIGTCLSRGSKALKARLAAAALMGVLRVVIEDWVATGAKSDLKKAGAGALALIAPMLKSRS